MKFSGLVFMLFLFSCQINENDPIDHVLLEDLKEFKYIYDQPEKYRLQIIYTQIDRDSQNKPILQTFSYRANPEEYFYPASTVKLPAAIMALEKLNEIKIEGLNRQSVMLTDSAMNAQTSVLNDSTSENNLPSVGHYIKKVFLVSDNDAFNRLYEFIGQEKLNKGFWEKGFEDVRITHRLSVFKTPEENRCTNPIRFLRDGQVIYSQPLVCYDSVIQASSSINLGIGVVVGDSIEMHPKDFSESNFISLGNLHEMLVSIIFPGTLTNRAPYNLTETDYTFLRKYMGMLPRESDYPHYGDKYPDNYCKFLMYADLEGGIPDQIRIFNKIGLAYGFLIDVAYIVDFENKIEFFLSAVISVNKNEIYNDGLYEYDSIGFPFFGALGRAFFNHELNRERKTAPNLQIFKPDYSY